MEIGFLKNRLFNYLNIFLLKVFLLGLVDQSCDFDLKS